MDYYSEIIQRIGHTERYKTILGAAVASVTTVYLLRRAIRSMSDNKSDEFKGIPVPKGEYFYLGINNKQKPSNSLLIILHLIGHMPLLGKRPGEVITKWHHQYGPIFRIKMGVQNWLFLGDPQIAHEILVSKGSITAGRPEHTFLGKIHGQGRR